MRELVYSPPFDRYSKRIGAVRRMKHSIDDQQLIGHRLATQLRASARGFYQRNTLRACHQDDRCKLWIGKRANRARVAFALGLQTR